MEGFKQTPGKTETKYYFDAQCKSIVKALLMTGLQNVP